MSVSFFVIRSRFGEIVRGRCKETSILVTFTLRAVVRKRKPAGIQVKNTVHVKAQDTTSLFCLHTSTVLLQGIIVGLHTSTQALQAGLPVACALCIVSPAADPERESRRTGTASGYEYTRKACASVYLPGRGKNLEGERGRGKHASHQNQPQPRAAAAERRGGKRPGRPGIHPSISVTIRLSLPHATAPQFHTPHHTRLLPDYKSKPVVSHLPPPSLSFPRTARH
jgi:hypothetical protein